MHIPIVILIIYTLGATFLILCVFLKTAIHKWRFLKKQYDFPLFINHFYYLIIFLFIINNVKF